MEYIEGSHTIPPGADRDQYMEKFNIFTSYVFLFNAIQHTDLHNGNFLFTERGFGIIDFGMAIQMSDAMHDVVLSIAAIIRDNPPLHEIDFIDTFKDLFSPPLDRYSMKDPAKVEDLCIEIARPLFDAIDADELNIMSTVSRLSQHIGKEVVFNTDVYKMLLGVSMMSAKTVIMGSEYSHEKFIRIQRRALRKAYDLIMN
jgi:thiamine kinase-like enzyme